MVGNETEKTDTGTELGILMIRCGRGKTISSVHDRQGCQATR